MPRKLLLADDSLTMQKVVSITFLHEDFTVTCVDNGEDALARVREMRPDVVLADVVMPRRNGYELCEAIKADPATSGIPVLLLAGTFEAFDEARARAAGADGHISKPFESGALIEKVRGLVGGAAPQPVAAAAPMQLTQPSIPRPGAPLAPPRPAVPQAPRPQAPPQAPPPPQAPAFRPPMPPPPGVRPPGPPPPTPSALRPLGPPPAAPSTSPRPFPMPPPPQPQAARPPPPRPPGFGPPAPMPKAPAPPPGVVATNGMTPPRPGTPTPGPAGAVMPRPPVRPSFPTSTPGPSGAVTPGPNVVRPTAPIMRAEDQLSLDDDISLTALTPPAGRLVAPVAAPPAPVADSGEAHLRAALSQASREVIERIAWEVVPQLAEAILREHVSKLKGS